MSQLRDDILQWSASGHLKPGDVPRAFEIAGLTPKLADWRNFLSTLLLWTGIILVASGVIFFFAYNWQSLHRFGKFALAEIIFAAALIGAWHFGIERPAGKAALFGAALLTGALLALLGQTYQTGADAFELFAFWAVLILPWVIAARFAPLWLMWIGLLNLSIAMYFQARAWVMLGLLFGTSGMLWCLFGINVIALAAWELGLMRGNLWLNRWGARVLATLAGGFATTIGILSIAGSREIGAWAILAYLAWMLAMYANYRLRYIDVAGYVLHSGNNSGSSPGGAVPLDGAGRLRPAAGSGTKAPIPTQFDVFMLAGMVLSAVVVIAAFLGKHLLFDGHGDAGGFLLIGLVIIGLSGAGAWWIRQVLRDHPQ